MNTDTDTIIPAPEKEIIRRLGIDGSKELMDLTLLYREEMGLRILFLKEPDVIAQYLSEPHNQPFPSTSSLNHLFEVFGIAQDLEKMEHSIIQAIAELYSKHKKSFAFPSVRMATRLQN